MNKNEKKSHNEGLTKIEIGEEIVQEARGCCSIDLLLGRTQALLLALLMPIITILLTGISNLAYATPQQSPVLVSTTSWSYPLNPATPGESPIRGIAFDGHYYYITNPQDNYLDTPPRPDDFTGRVYIYDTDGHFIKRIPESLTGIPHGTFFPHGVATDGVKLWMTDYWGSHIYEFSIATGGLVRKFSSPIGSPLRLDYDAATQTLWVTAFGNPSVYQVDLNGNVLGSFLTEGFHDSRIPALDGQGGLWIGDNSNMLKRYAFDGSVVDEFPGYKSGYSSIATNINKREDGFYQDTKPAFNSVTGKWETKFEHYVVAASFAVFTPSASMTFGTKSQDDSFKVSAKFDLGTESNGIDPVSEDVGITFGSFSTTIPAGEFQQQDSGHFTFQGTINKVDLKAQIHMPQISSDVVAKRFKPIGYWFKLEATGADLDGTVVPPEIKLTIGDDTGEAKLNGGKAQFGEGNDDKHKDDEQWLWHDDQETKGHRR